MFYQDTSSKYPLKQISSPRRILASPLTALTMTSHHSQAPPLLCLCRYLLFLLIQHRKKQVFCLSFLYEQPLPRSHFQSSSIDSLKYLNVCKEMSALVLNKRDLLALGIICIKGPQLTSYKMCRSILYHLNVCERFWFHVADVLSLDLAGNLGRCLEQVSHQAIVRNLNNNHQ